MAKKWLKMTKKWLKMGQKWLKIAIFCVFLAAVEKMIISLYKKPPNCYSMTNMFKKKLSMACSVCFWGQKWPKNGQNDPKWPIFVFFGCCLENESIFIHKTTQLSLYDTNVQEKAFGGMYCMFLGPKMAKMAKNGQFLYFWLLLKK